MRKDLILLKIMNYQRDCLKEEKLDVKLDVMLGLSTSTLRRLMWISEILSHLASNQYDALMANQFDQLRTLNAELTTFLTGRF